jgi:hypothetical protein
MVADGDHDGEPRGFDLLCGWNSFNIRHDNNKFRVLVTTSEPPRHVIVVMLRRVGPDSQGAGHEETNLIQLCQFGECDLQQTARWRSIGLDDFVDMR